MRSPVRHTFAALRLAVGLSAWALPNTTERIFALPPSPQPFVLRLFGARETALALAIQSLDPDRRRLALQVGVLIDGVDAVGGLVDFVRGRLAPRAAVLGSGGAVGFALLGMAALTEERRSPATS